MAKIYEFPQGAERGKLKKEIIRERKKRLREKNGNPVIRHVKWFWFYLRFATAGALHLVSVITLAVLGAFSKAIFWIGGLLCVVTWFHLERQFWTPQNFTIPVIVTLWGLSLFATPLMELLNKKMPWYRFLVPDAKHTNTEATNDDQL
ncbi:hypothetical protein HKX50_26945 [Klebsiella pneumoniae]|uniref:hypothetical protein n=1 Tax=Enterobacteriaceae TaxID=543 RepID=UPI0007642FB2|nr:MULTISPECIES: hypothetical protein [Enterobacteriaceae]EBS9146111.1 hypothetical protein [Salmonella enterica]ECS6493838.1 hypothetical protein [Salmonella enterica subsp. enterica serovar Herston]EEM4711228.1 hypothetical protein [Salmonella enterica subsp. enterica serovar Rubislaw]HBS1001045.1 hypothetical protein [Klebsiella quasipneumoniae subsp. similipneumoniae]HCB1556176.1 hypothetical protein [Enterobacter asburiae]